MADLRERQTDLERRGRAPAEIVGGALLIGLGLVLLLGRFIPDFGRFIPLAVGLALLAGFFVTRAYGLLVPGAIVTGVGIGIILASQAPGEGGGGLFLLSLAGGFVAIWLLGLLFHLPERHPWPLIPGGILALIGVATALGPAGRQALELLGQLWPLILIAIGVWVLVRARSRKEASED